jgi:predicted ATP-binding protein involved in virulence
MIYIKKLTIKDFGPFENQEIEFELNENEPNIHIFAGINGTGKTSILHSLASAFDYFEPDHKEHHSNNIHKRFWKNNGNFNENENGMTNSFTHSILVDSTGKIVDKIINYGCKNCGNIHQNFEKTISRSFDLSKNGKNYQHKPQSNDLAYYKNAITSKDINGKKLKFAAFGYSGYRLIESEKIEIKEKENFNPLHLALEFVKKKDGSEREFNISNWIISRYSKAAIEEINGNKEKADRYRNSTLKLIECINSLADNVYSININTNPWSVNITYCEKILEFDILPDGLRSILSWLGDLLMRLDSISWENENIPVTEQNIFLFLDEIEVHLHPIWQYKILSIVSKLLPNAQIFITTHSPFIINSIDNAKLYVLTLDNCKSTLKETLKTQTGWSVSYVLNNILNAKHRFGNESEINLAKFNQLDNEIAQLNYKNEAEFLSLIDKLKLDGLEVFSMIAPKLMRLKTITGKDYLHGKN